MFCINKTIEKQTKGCIPPFPKKGDLGIPKNYRGITLTAIAAKVYNALHLIRILSDKIKLDIFNAVSVLLYGCTICTLTTNTKILHTALNKSWKQHPTKHPPIRLPTPHLTTSQLRRTRYTGNCWKSKDELISDVILWTPTHGHTMLADQWRLKCICSVRALDKV